MLKIFFLVFILLSSNSFAQSEFFGLFSGDLQEEIEMVQDDKKDGIFVFFDMDNCPFCKKMEDNVLSDKDVSAFYNKHFSNIEIDINGDIEMVDFDEKDITQKIFAFRHNARATPMLIFFDIDGNKVFSRVGATNKADFLLMGEFVVSKAYLTTNFVRYKRQHKKY